MKPRLLVFLTTQITSAVSTVVLPVCCVKDTVGFAYGCSENFTDTESVFGGKWKNYDVEWSFNKSLSCVDLIHYEDQNVRIDGKGNLFVTCSDGWCCGNECAVRHAGLNDEKNEYCMDYSDGTLRAVVCDNSMPISNSSNETSVEETSTFWLKNPGIGNTCTIISIIALIATCLLILTDDTKSQEDYVLYVVSQSVAQILMLISSVIDCSPRNSKCWECLLKGYSLQYLGLCAFFWMNATSLQMHVNLSQKRTESTRKLLRWREFKIFSLYAWGTPLLISAATYWLQMSQILDGFCSLKPDISVTTCFLRSTAPLLIYFYGPATIILVINTILFGIIASILAKIEAKQKRLLKKKTTGFFRRYVKLFLATGITWIGDVINWAFLEHHSGCLGVVSGVLDIFVNLQGLYIFYFFVFNNEELLGKLLHILRLRKCSKNRNGKITGDRCCENIQLVTERKRTRAL